MDYPDVPFSSEDVNNIALISYGYMSFDNIGVAMLTILQMITLEGWTDLMY
jgi:voltage-dependent calcium channel L type alpha-1D